jgi:hypothetical protein
MAVAEEPLHQDVLGGALAGHVHHAGDHDLAAHDRHGVGGQSLAGDRDEDLPVAAERGIRVAVGREPHEQQALPRVSGHHELAVRQRGDGRGRGLRPEDHATNALVPEDGVEVAG